MSEDNVNHPKHYVGHASGVECIDIALKYVWRAKHKGREEEDLKKALWYVRRELRLERLIPTEDISDKVTKSVILNAQKVIDVEGEETLLSQFLKEICDDSNCYEYRIDELLSLLIEVVEPQEEDA